MLVGWRKTVSTWFVVPQRVVLAIMGFFAIVNAYTMRICLSVAITEMVKKTVNNSSIEAGDTCPIIDDGSGSEPTSSGEFEWNEELQGLILSAFYWGYVITHLPGGYLAERFGGKYTLSLGILSTAIFTLLTPVVVEAGGPTWLIVLRVLQGLGEGTTFPALSALLAMWIPLNERSKLGSLVFGGGQVGTILGTYLSSVLLHNIEGWHSVFYFFGALGVLWFILFTMLCYSDPGSHPFIKDEEKQFLEEELGKLKRDKSLPPVPWKMIITSVPMIALITAQVGHDWGFFIMVTDLPKYMSDVLRFNIKDLGFYASLPYAVMWIVSISTGFLSDWLITTGKITITQGRKWFTAVAAVGPGIFIVAASYAGCGRGAVVALFTIAMGIMGTFYPGMKVNSLDLSPNYAGSLMALTNGIGAITGIVAPYVVGVMTPDSTLTQWRMVFWVAFAVFMVTTVVYSLWASGETQPWNEPHLMYKENRSVENGAFEHDENDDIGRLKRKQQELEDQKKN